MPCNSASPLESKQLDRPKYREDAKVDVITSHETPLSSPVEEKLSAPSGAPSSSFFSADAKEVAGKVLHCSLRRQVFKLPSLISQRLSPLKSQFSKKNR